MTAALLAAALVVVLTVIGEPRHEGRTLEEWLVLLDSDINRHADREAAGLAIRRMGVNAVPGVRRILQLQPKSWSQRIRGFAVRAHLVKAPGVSLNELQSRAAHAAWLLAEDAGDDIGSLVPFLRFHFTNSNYAETQMARALVRSGPPGIACLTNLLATGVPRVRDHSGWALAFDEAAIRQPGSWDAVIQGALSDPDPRVRSNFVLYLSKFRGQGDAAKLVPLGLQFLRGTDPNGRWAGAELLGAHLSVPEARAALEGVLEDPDQRVRASAHRRLQALRQQPVAR